MKNIKKNIVIIVILSIIVLFFTLKDDFYGVTKILLNSNILYLLLLILVILLGDLFKGCSFWVLIRNIKKDYKIKDSFLLILRSEFFYGITPFAVGGQPYQVYELKNKEDIAYSDGVNIVFKDYYGYQLAFVTLITIFLIVNSIFNIITLNDVTIKLLVIGYCVNLGAILFLEYLKYSKIKHDKIINFFTRILYKIKIVKDKESLSLRINNALDRIRKQVKNSEYKLVFKSYLFSILKLIMLGLAGYLSLKATYVDNAQIINSIIIIIFIMNLSSFVPIPGGTGGMEYGFITLFSIYATGAQLNAAMLLWRFTGFYFLTLFGALMLIIEEKIKKRRKENG